MNEHSRHIETLLEGQVSRATLSHLTFLHLAWKILQVPCLKHGG